MSKISSIFVSRRRALMRHEPIIRLSLGVILFLPLSNFTPVTVHPLSYIVSSKVFFFDRLGDYRLSVTCRWRIWKNRMHPQWWRVKDSFLPRYKSMWKGLRRISEIFYFHLYPWLSSYHQIVTFSPFFFLLLYYFSFLKVFYDYFFRGS